MDAVKPRWEPHMDEANRADLKFLGRAGPLDIWVDLTDPFTSYLVMWSKDPTREGHTHSTWCGDAEWIITKVRRDYVNYSDLHLTLHDECMIYRLCAEYEEGAGPRTVDVGPVTLP